MYLPSLLFGTFFGFTAVIFGAFGAHLLKKKLSIEQLSSFETGVKYQMYHAILLLILGYQLNPKTSINSFIVYTFIFGIFLFCFSIYGLVISSAANKKITFLGPITPIGGMFLLIGWALLFYKYIALY